MSWTRIGQGFAPYGRRNETNWDSNDLREMLNWDKIYLHQGDITKLKVDAVVNAAHTTLLGGGGVDGAIHLAAGPRLLKECHTLDGCRTGDAKMTKGYNLPARYVIHAVGPVWSGGKKSEAELLEGCYRACMKIAEENNLKSIAFPCISTGIYRFPKHPAAEIAIGTVRDCLKILPCISKVVFACFSEEDFDLYKALLSKSPQQFSPGFS